MATRTELRKITRARITAAKILIEAKDYDYAGYTMGFVLECALKACVCKKLDLTSYPADDSSIDSNIRSTFRTHEFDMLQMLAGLSNKFTNTGSNPYFASWSAATKDYIPPGNQQWVNMRYQPNYWTESKVKSVYNALTKNTNGILVYLKKRW